MVKTRREVSNAEFEEALKNCDNEGIIKSVSARYSHFLSCDQLHTCGLNALWRTMQYHDNTRGYKFTTNLHNFMEWECRLELKKRSRIKKKEKLFSDIRNADNKTLNHSSTWEDLEHIRTHMVGLSDEQRNVVEQYYFDHKTIKQISLTIGCSVESTRQKILSATAKLKRLCLESLV